MATIAEQGHDADEPSTADIRLVISASALGTVFEWYDFFIYGTLAASGIIGRTFFPGGNEMLQTLLAWAGFAVGFGFRPLGAVVFGYLGDRLGRKYTFLVTITLMGIATAGVGLIPSYAAIGMAAPALVILLRIAQGLALGGEYGGAAIYVAEHSPPGKSGYYTSFIQAGVAGGFILSLIVILSFKGVLHGAAWEEWGWRAPFLFSIVLLAISLWMRLKLSESPVFKKMREAGERASNPLVESFTYPGNLKRMLVALFGFIVIRTLTRAYATEDMFSRFAASGLAILFGVQATINMAVNLQLIPAKGMTLPFISYGGSSFVSLAYGVGMMLALTRQRPRTEIESMEGASTQRAYA